METKSLKLVCFSPTGKTKAVVQGISSGINQCSMGTVDITRPDARKKPIQTSGNELLVIAVPVYMGRVPALLMKWLQAIRAQKTPVVCVVVYGNRVYDDAACIKNCPKRARTMKDGLVKDASIRLSTLLKERKEPEIFL